MKHQKGISAKASKEVSAGFALIESVLILIILGLLGGASWYVWKSNHDTEKSLDQTSQLDAQAPIKRSKLKEYKNEEYGFSFQYPNSWDLKENLFDGGRGHNEGDVIVTSPSGTKVDFGPNLGGKGGDCIDDQAGDTRTTRTCVTRNILSVEKLSSSSTMNPIYFYHASWTNPTDSGGKTHYYIYIENGDYAPKKTGAEIGAFLESWDLVSTRVGALNISVEGKDDIKNNTVDFFTSREVKEATPVLKSFRLL